MPLSKRPVQTHKRSSRIGALPVAAIVLSMGCMALVLQGCFSPIYPNLGREERAVEALTKSETAEKQLVLDVLTQYWRSVASIARDAEVLKTGLKKQIDAIQNSVDMASLPSAEGARRELAVHGDVKNDKDGVDSVPDVFTDVDDSEEPYVVNGWTRFTRPQKPGEILSGDSGEKKERPGSRALADGSDESYVVNGWTHFTRPRKIQELSPGDFGEREELSSSAPLEREQADQPAVTRAPDPEVVPEAAVVDLPVAKVEVRTYVLPEVQTMEPPRIDSGEIPKATITGLIPYPSESFLIKMAEEDAAAREEKARRMALEPLQPIQPLIPAGTME